MRHRDSSPRYLPHNVHDIVLLYHTTLIRIFPTVMCPCRFNLAEHGSCYLSKMYLAPFSVFSKLAFVSGKPFEGPHDPSGSSGFKQEGSEKLPQG